MISRWLRATVACALLAANPAQPQPPSSAASREDAYRANNLGVALLEQFNFEPAAAAFRNALRLAPELGIAHLNLSIALMQEQELEAAGAEAAAAERLMPGAPQPPYLLALIARNENRDEDAIRLFERVRAIDARDTGTLINLAQIHIQNRRYPEAIALLRPAVADEPYSITAAYNLGIALTRAGQRDEGQRIIERSQALRATGYGTTLSNAYLEQGRYAEALASTGAESDLVDPATPGVTLTPAAIGPADPAPAAPSPFGRQFTAADLAPDGLRALAASLGGCLTMIDFDRDGDLDVMTASASGQKLLRNDGPSTSLRTGPSTSLSAGGGFTDVTSTLQFPASPEGAVPVGCLAGDVDNDGVPDLVVVRYGASSLYKNDGAGRFTDVTARTGLRPLPFLPGAAALVDVDHDGDVDLVVAGLADLEASRQRANGRSLVFPRDFAPAPVAVLRNNGDGTFTDTTREAGIAVASHAVALVPTDYDNRRDIDLMIVAADAPPVLLKNLRDGTFGDVAGDVGLAAVAPGSGEFTSAAAADVNKDDYPDFIFGRTQGPAVVALSDGRGRFVLSSEAADTRSALFFDYDNDGLQDLLTWSANGPRLARNIGPAGTSFRDVTSSAFPAATSGTMLPGSARGLAVADVDGDGREDLIARTADGALVVWRSGGSSPNSATRVRLKGVVSNRTAIGSKVQVRAGSLSQRLETSAATPPVAPTDLIFGLARRAGADVVRVLWPSGILQAESANLGSAVDVEELNRKPSSCPFLYTWNGQRFEFVTDFMGGGEIGYWEGPNTYNHPDPIEYVRIRGDQLREKDGRYELRVTNELEETLFVDRLQLVRVAHPVGVDVFPDEGMTEPPKPFRLFAVKDRRPPVAANDSNRRDVTDRLARLDRIYADGFELKTVRGYAAPHELTIDIGTPPPNPVLLLTGWTDYAFSSDNVAAHQAGLHLAPPSLDVRDVAGTWRRAIDNIGIPVGRPQTIVVDLAPLLRAGEHEVRIGTNMRIYWDQFLVGTSAGAGVLPRTSSDPAAAILRERGFSLEVRPDGTEPPIYDYDRATRESPWKTMPGRYTRVGDVQPLLTRSDDMFVIAKPGDEIAVEFDASLDRALPAGWTQTFLLRADGFSKEMDLNSASPDVAAPWPFHGMTRYPYSPHERVPDSRRHQEYREMYNTRVVKSPLPPLAPPR